jgi:hypothetical protein
MKIRNDELQALQQLQGETRIKPKVGNGFEALLSEQLGATQDMGEEAGASPLMGGLSAQFSPALLGLTEDGAKTAGTQSLDEISQSIDGLFTTMDAYAASLSSPEGDLRNAYSTLQSMSKELKALRESAPDLGTRHAGLDAMVNELEVMTVTETFKFNRGDYL